MMQFLKFREIVGAYRKTLFQEAKLKMIKMKYFSTFILMFPVTKIDPKF